ncbi:VWA domain-containing protein [Hyphomicrobium sp. CS1GBMeth3]|uniref:vWA domain-containing protein n=1 Tax=Hyphomicrobium sp. CS1GBMeth3 TaxID=1892845 RepID=UPI000B30E9FC|nr:VWA domain-containing protein [Hyphomicrobium sp. CS1GBMeth3]
MQISRFTLHVVGVLALLLVSSGLVIAQQTKPSCLDDAMLVFDASGSMAATDFPDGAPSRLDRVRQALVKVLPAATRARRLGLIVYGPGPNYDTCRNVTLRLPPSANAGDRIMAMVDGLRPQGRTALTSSVRQAVDLLRHGEKPAVIVALTDGRDTCGGDACQLALELKLQHPGVTVHVIGYRLTSMSGVRSAFVERCLADETGGIFATAETTEDLANALSETLGCPAVTHLAPHHFR